MKIDNSTIISEILSGLKSPEIARKYFMVDSCIRVRVHKLCDSGKLDEIYRPSIRNNFGEGKISNEVVISEVISGLRPIDIANKYSMQRSSISARINRMCDCGKLEERYRPSNMGRRKGYHVSITYPVKLYDDKLISMIISGKRVVEISKENNISSSAVIRRVHRLCDLGKISENFRPNCFNSRSYQRLFTDQEIIDLYNTGNGIIAITNKLKFIKGISISPSSIQKHLDKLFSCGKLIKEDRSSKKKENSRRGRRRELRFNPSVMKEAFIREKGICRVCSSFLDHDFGINYHHIKLACFGGLGSVENCLPLHFECHFHPQLFGILHGCKIDNYNLQLFPYQKNVFVEELCRIPLIKSKPFFSDSFSEKIKIARSSADSIIGILNKAVLGVDVSEVEEIEKNLIVREAS